MPSILDCLPDGNLRDSKEAMKENLLKSRHTGG
jgi:hypothetical protein